MVKRRANIKVSVKYLQKKVLVSESFRDRATAKCIDIRTSLPICKIRILFNVTNLDRNLLLMYWSTFSLHHSASQ